MTRKATHLITLGTIDEATRQLVRVAAAVAASDDNTVRDVLAASLTDVPPLWVEEVILQSHLFAGFPRALNAMREWRGMTAIGESADPTPAFDRSVRDAGEATCRVVYGTRYDRLRETIRALHPALDDWMIVNGYGAVLSRPGLDLPRRELCIVAACVASGQERQLHSHLHGSLNVGVAPGAVTEALNAMEGIVDPNRLTNARRLFARLSGDEHVH